MEASFLSVGSADRSSWANNGNSTCIPPTEFRVLCMEWVMTAFTSCRVNITIIVRVWNIHFLFFYSRYEWTACVYLRLVHNKHIFALYSGSILFFESYEIRTKSYTLNTDELVCRKEYMFKCLGVYFQIPPSDIIIINNCICMKRNKNLNP